MEISKESYVYLAFKKGLCIYLKSSRKRGRERSLLLAHSLPSQAQLGPGRVRAGSHRVGRSPGRLCPLLPPRHIGRKLGWKWHLRGSSCCRDASISRSSSTRCDTHPSFGRAVVHQSADEIREQEKFDRA